jgi:hypothetical protein
MSSEGWEYAVDFSCSDWYPVSSAKSNSPFLLLSSFSQPLFEEEFCPGISPTSLFLALLIQDHHFQVVHPVTLSQQPIHSISRKKLSQWIPMEQTPLAPPERVQDPVLG